MMKKRILCFGDSITWGYDPVSRVRFPEEDRWPMVLQNELGPSYQIIEEGQCGRTIATEDPAEGEKNGSAYIVPCLESQSPLDLVIIMLGTNDCKRKFAYSASDVAGEMELFLEKVLSYNHFHCNDRFKVLLVSPPVISDAIRPSWLEDIFVCDHAAVICAGLAEKYKELAERFGCAFLNADDYVKTSGTDGVHLDPEAQQALGKAIAGYVSAIF